jgi:transposase
MYSIGLDISKATISVHIPKNCLDIEIDNNQKSLKSLYSKLKKLYKKELDKLVFVYEPTGNYSTLLERFCAAHNIHAFIIGPKESRNFAKAIAQRNKSDKVDAQVLSKAIVIAQQDKIAVPTINPLVEEMKELIGYYRLKVKQRVQLENHLESLVAKQDNSAIIKRVKSEIKIMKSNEECIIEDVYTLILQDELLQKKYESILSIDGIGKVSAIILVHLFIRYPNANQRQIISLAGLDPIVKESGTSVKGRSRISKAGARIYRGTLFMATMVATRFNPQMKQFYERLKANGKHTTVAQIAVMRKLIVVAHSLYNSGELYDKTRFVISTGCLEKSMD